MELDQIRATSLYYEVFILSAYVYIYTTSYLTVNNTN